MTCLLDEPVRFKITGEGDDHVVLEDGVVVCAGTKDDCFRFVGEAQGRHVPESRRERARDVAAERAELAEVAPVARVSDDHLPPVRPIESRSNLRLAGLLGGGFKL